MFGLGQLAEVISRFGAPNLSIHPEMCSPLRHRNSTCQRCVNHCPARAVVVGDTLQIIEEKCTGCGICAAVCPTGALEATRPTNVELLDRIAEDAGGKHLIFACPKAVRRDDERDVEIACLGRIDESILVSAGVQGKCIFLVDGPCQECPHAIGRKIAARAAAEAIALLHALHIEPRIEFTRQPLQPVEGAAVQGSPLSRRAFFSALTHETKAIAAVAASTILESPNDRLAEIKKGELPRRIPAKRQLLLHALRELGPACSPEFETQTGAWAMCNIRPDCIGCQMCALFCPTGALSNAEHDGRPALAFRVARCTNCGLCQDLCHWKSIELASRIDLGMVLEDTPHILSVAAEAMASQSPGAKLQRLIESIR